MSGVSDVPPELPWVPSPRLRGRLAGAALAAAVAGILSAASWSFEIIQGDREGLTPARLLGLASLIPTLRVVGAFGALGREAGYPSLGRSVRSFFGVLSLLGWYDLASQPTLPPSARVAGLVVFWIGMAAVPVLPFVSRAGTFALGVSAVLSGAAWALLGVVPLAASLSGEAGEAREVAEGVAVGLLAMLAGPLLLWFAASKIRARGRLGGLAALMGWAEVVGLLFLLVWALVGIGTAIAVAVGGPEVDERIWEDIGTPIEGGLVVVGAVGDLLLTPLTVWLFLSIRGRRGGPGPDLGKPPDAP